MNPRSLNSRISDIGASDSKVSRASDAWVSEASDSKVSEVSSRGLDLESFLLESEKRSRSLGPETLSNFDLGLWAFGLMKVNS